ncbi:MAG: DUF2283 domain-containing protein [Magnetococcales bacterium]|nr:DUF2283 domain-containing protein [Magnetococcales bacterium]
MKTIYYPKDDILVIRLSDNPSIKDVSQNWNVSISYGVNGEVVEIVILEAKEKGLFPVETEKLAALINGYLIRVTGVRYLIVFIVFL